jgi:amino acid adenylation domain-containing protein
MTLIFSECANAVGHSDGTRNSFLPGKLARLSPVEREQFHQFGRGPSAMPDHPLIHRAFEAHAAARPDAIAAQCAGESITYGALDREATRLAARLAAEGVTAGDCVALFVHRSIHMLVGMLAALKLGAAYVPQHVGVAPESQLLHVIRAASTRVILTLSHLRDRVPVPAGHVCLSVDDFADRCESVRRPPSTSISPDATCFVLFTSGTTGKPNGVRVTHRNVCNILLTEPGRLGMKPGAKVAQILSIAFDMAAWEILGSLANGATLLIRGQDIAETAEQANVVIATPSILATLDPKRCPQVQFVAVAGEPCPKSLADRWATGRTFFNACGPTETTIVNTMQHYRGDGGPLTIGKPTSNNTVYILDSKYEPCAIGETGEMWAGGDCVTAGYIGNDALNRERYVPDPFLGGGRLMFRTRDLGRWTAGGELEHLGRTDDQVKIRGFRVELDSVSNVLEATPSISRAATLPLNTRDLIAFVTPRNADIDAALQRVRANLPYYCVPARIVALDAFPLTPRGKIDRRALIDLPIQPSDSADDADDVKPTASEALA